MIRKVSKIFSSVILGIIYIYRIAISPLLPASCRFTPTCSAYAISCLRDNNIPLYKAVFLIIKRVIKCHPFNKSKFIQCDD